MRSPNIPMSMPIIHDCPVLLQLSLITFVVHLLVNIWVDPVAKHKYFLWSCDTTNNPQWLPIEKCEKHTNTSGSITLQCGTPRLTTASCHFLHPIFVYFSICNNWMRKILYKALCFWSFISCVAEAKKPKIDYNKLRKDRVAAVKAERY